MFRKWSEIITSSSAANSTGIRSIRFRSRNLTARFCFSAPKRASDFADFLLGIPSQYNQSQLQPFYGRNKYLGLYGQDSWRIKSNLTLNYGVRWDRIEPWYEKYNQLAVFEPGKQSVVFPNAPEGMLFPTDPGVPRTLAPRETGIFRPASAWPIRRMSAATAGSAKSSAVRDRPVFARVSGHSIARSRRSRSEYRAQILRTGRLTPAPVRRFLLRLSSRPQLGSTTDRRFPAQLAPLGATRQHPNPNVDFTQFEPISGIPAYPTTNRIPYTEEYALSLQRALGGNTVLSVNYVGNQAHRLPVLIENNPGDPALCLSLSTHGRRSAEYTDLRSLRRGQRLYHGSKSDGYGDARAIQF